MRAVIQRIERYFSARKQPSKFDQAIKQLREIEVNLRISEKLVQLHKEGAEAKDREIEQLQLDLIGAQTRANAWERSAKDLLEKLNQQAELNADLIQSNLEIEASLGRHSGNIDRERFQVLTQFTGRRLNIKSGLLGALHDAVSLNIARHIIKKLARGDYFDASKPMSAEEFRALQAGTHPAINKEPKRILPSR